MGMKLDISGLTAGYGSNHVIERLNLSIASGEIVTLIGTNGCGKSTLLKTMARILKPCAGTVCLESESVHSMNTGLLAKQLAILPQIHAAPEDVTVRQLIEYGRFPHHGAWRIASSRDRAAVDDILKMTRLEELASRKVMSLSGGERQRAWIAMTLAQEPKVLLLDEPTTFLDVCCQFEVVELVRKLNRKLGITVVMVLHDLNLAARCSDRLAAIRDRRILHVGTPREIITPEILREIFNIESEVIYGRDGVPFFIPVGSCREVKP